MFQVIGCITNQHDLRLVVLAGVLCLFACSTAMSMVARGHVATGGLSAFWLASAGVVAGCGIWATHFVAMLAYTINLPVAYDTGLTLLSLLIAASLCGIGFALANGWNAIGGGVIMGGAISAMHFVGMAALTAPADAVWDANYVIASIAIGAIVMPIAMRIALRRENFRGYATAAVLFTLAICALHFTAMAAVTYVPNPLALAIPEAVLSPTTLAIAVAAVAILILALGMIGAMVDRHLAQRASSEAERLRVYIAELEKTKLNLEETTDHLATALKTAAAASAAKSQFLATVSHELRTPLNAINGFSEMIAKEIYGPLGDPRYRDYVRDIRGSGEHLLSVINDILDLSRLDTGEVVLEEEKLDLASVIEDAERMIRPQFDSAANTLTVALDPDLPLVRADRRRVMQVLINLLDNAVKFTPAGGRVCVSASCSGGGVAITVSDTGIGIAESDIATAFDRFSQVDGRLSRRYEGVGLGLPLARQFMELHGGTLTLKSQVGVGTTVTATFPPARVSAGRLKAA